MSLFYFKNFSYLKICCHIYFVETQNGGFMKNFEIYNDIAKRTNGDIYVGVVEFKRTTNGFLCSLSSKTTLSSALT